MHTQVSFTADPILKQKALEKARDEGVTLKALLTFAMKNFVEGKLAFGLFAVHEENDVEEIVLTTPSIRIRAEKLAKLLK